MNILLREVGRKLSKANEEKLRAAHKTLQEILDQLASSSDDGEVVAAEAMDWYASELGYLSLIERNVPVEERIALAKKGQAIPVKDAQGNIINGRYPVATEDDLANALTSSGRGGGLTAEIKGFLMKMCQKFNHPVPDTWKEADSGNPGEEPVAASFRDLDVSSDVVSLKEAVISPDGTMLVKCIRPGWGTSGYYSKSLLEHDGPEAFPRGTKMFWDHPTDEEERARPEGSLNNMAAEFVTDATYMESGPKGPGLYAKAKVFDRFRKPLEELASHIGVSIRASGSGKIGEAEGKRGRIIERIARGKSVDYVTMAGAGGEIVQLFEAARHSNDHEDNNTVDEAEVKRLREALAERDKRISRLSELELLRTSREKVSAMMDTKGVNLPVVTRTRIAESVAGNPPVNDKGELDVVKLTENLDAAITEETNYLVEAGAIGRVRSMGGNTGNGGGNANPETDTSKLTERAAAIFQGWGLSETAAQTAAKGRQ